MKLLKLFSIIFCVFLYTSCGQMGVKAKDNYISDYEVFVKEVRVLHENFTEEEWEEYRLKYELLSVEEKKKHAKHFTEEDIQKIASLEEEYASYLVAEEIDDFLNTLGDGIKKGLEELGDFFEEVTKDLEDGNTDTLKTDTLK